MELSRSALNSRTVPSLALPALVEACAGRGIAAITPWRDLIAEPGPAASGKIIRDAGLDVSALCRGGDFTAESAAGRRDGIDDTRRAVDEAAELGAPVLVVVGGPVVGKDPAGSRAMIRDGLEAVLPHARDAGVTLGLEPLHPMMATSRSAVTSLREANDLREAIGEPGLDVAVDIYHVWWEDDLAGQIARAAGHVAGFHVSDWVTPVEGELTSRGMMGDGCIDIPAVREQVLAGGYTGPIEVEIFSDHWWSRDPLEVLDVVCERFRTAV